MTRFWCSWVQPTEDYRPLTDPPNAGILGWWCTGYDPDDHATLCALVEASSEVEVREVVALDWPEIAGLEWRIGPNPVAGDWRPSDRFVLTDWERVRIEGGREASR